MKSFEDNVLKATHETPKKHYIDDQTYTFQNDSSAGCSVQVCVWFHNNKCFCRHSGQVCVKQPEHTDVTKSLVTKLQDVVPRYNQTGRTT